MDDVDKYALVSRCLRTMDKQQENCIFSVTFYYTQFILDIIQLCFIKVPPKINTANRDFPICFAKVLTAIASIHLIQRGLVNPD